MGIDGPGRFKHSTGGDLRPSAVRCEPAVKGVAVPRGRWKGGQLAVLRRAAGRTHRAAIGVEGDREFRGLTVVIAIRGVVLHLPLGVEGDVPCHRVVEIPCLRTVLVLVPVDEGISRFRRVCRLCHLAAAGNRSTADFGAPVAVEGHRILRLWGVDHHLYIRLGDGQNRIIRRQPFDLCGLSLHRPDLVVCAAVVYFNVIVKAVLACIVQTKLHKISRRIKLNRGFHNVRNIFWS